MNVYRGIYSRKRFAAKDRGRGGGGGGPLRVESPLLDLDILLLAISTYARDNGLYVWQGDEEEENEEEEDELATPPRPLVRSAGIPSMGRVSPSSEVVRGGGRRVAVKEEPRVTRVTFEDPNDEVTTPTLEEIDDKRPSKMILPPDPPKLVSARPKKRQ